MNIKTVITWIAIIFMIITWLGRPYRIKYVGMVETCCNYEINNVTGVTALILLD